MPDVLRFRALVIVLGLVGAHGCDGGSRDAHRASDRAGAQSIDPDGDHADLHARATSGEVVIDATAAFDARRTLRFTTVRAQHAVIASQARLLSTMVETFPLTDEGRSDVNQKLVILLMRLDESGNVLESLKTASIRDFKDRDEAVTEAMARLEQARKDAWTALEDAPRTDRSS